jgi:hypothetical protein
MANYVKEKSRFRNAQIGAPLKNGLPRDRWLAKQRATVDELALINELKLVLSKRLKIHSTMDMIMYLVEKEYSKQDHQRVISSITESL